MPGSAAQEAPSGRPVLVVHVMKTGGTTLFANLGDNYAPDEIYPNPDLDIVRDETATIGFRHLTLAWLAALPEERRRRIRVYTGHFPYVAREVLGGDLDVLTILRDPVERTISLLRQLRRPEQWAGRGGTDPLAERSLEEVYEQAHVFEPLVHNHQTKIFSMHLGDHPTGYMQVIDVDESRLALAQDNLEQVEVVGLTERYDAFLDEVRTRYGWRVPRAAKVNVAPEEQPVSAALRRRIADDNAIDVELYAWATDLVERRRRSR